MYNYMFIYMFAHLSFFLLHLSSSFGHVIYIHSKDGTMTGQFVTRTRLIGLLYSSSSKLFFTVLVSEILVGNCINAMFMPSFFYWKNTMTLQVELQDYKLITHFIRKNPIICHPSNKTTPQSNLYHCFPRLVSYADNTQHKIYL